MAVLERHLAGLSGVTWSGICRSGKANRKFQSNLITKGFIWREKHCFSQNIEYRHSKKGEVVPSRL